MNRTLSARSNGQAMIESLLIVVLLTSLLFGTLSIGIMVINDMISAETAFSAGRVAAVSAGDRNEIDRRAKLAAAALLVSQTSQTGFIPRDTRTNYAELGDFEYRSGGKAVRQTTEFRYVGKGMFSRLITPFERTGFQPGGNMQDRVASVRMIKSPDQNYYNKAYDGAPNN